MGRPPLLIRNDRIAWEKVDLLPEFTEKTARSAEKFIPSVGRVEFLNHDMSWGGTGFVVEALPGNRRRVLTNRHVAVLVARRAADGTGVFLRSPLGPRYGAKLDMREEVNSPRNGDFELPVTRIDYIADDTEADMAILEITVRAGSPLPRSRWRPSAPGTASWSQPSATPPATAATTGRRWRIISATSMT